MHSADLFGQDILRKNIFSLDRNTVDLVLHSFLNNQNRSEFVAFLVKDQLHMSLRKTAHLIQKLDLLWQFIKSRAVDLLEKGETSLQHELPFELIGSEILHAGEGYILEIELFSRRYPVDHSHQVILVLNGRINGRKNVTLFSQIPDDLSIPFSQTPIFEYLCFPYRSKEV